MNSFLVNGLIAGLFFVFPASSAAEHASSKHDFLGTWQGNDPLDGGLITLEITEDADDDGVLDLRFSLKATRTTAFQFSSALSYS